MYKRANIIKRAISFLLIIFMCINSFAAVISDNDGSAFITKGEFDSIKNDFQTQINDYNTSIDNKIDGAIAQYLAGIRILSGTKNNIINSNWGSVTAINGVVNPTFKYPNCEILYFYATHASDKYLNDTIWDNNGSKGFTLIDSMIGKIGMSYKQSFTSTETVKRPLCTVTGNEASYGDIIWDGIARRYCETFDLVRTSYSGHHFSYLDQPSSSNVKVYIRDLTTFKWDGGYIDDWKSGSKDGWPISFQHSLTYSGNKGPYAYSFGSDHEYDVKVASVELAPVGGSDRELEHVVNWDNNKAWTLSNPNFSKTFRIHSLNTLTSNNYATVVTYNSKASRVSANSGSHVISVVTPNYSTVADSVLSSVGMLNSDYYPIDIYQDNNISDVVVEKNRFTKIRPTLRDGLQLLCANKDENINWSPVFDYVYAKDSSGTYATNSHEIDIYLSYVPFTDGNTSTDKVMLQGPGGVLVDHITTSGRKANLKWDMAKSGMVYVKWCPHFTGTSYLTDDWQARLDINNCNQYTYINND